MLLARRQTKRSDNLKKGSSAQKSYPHNAWSGLMQAPEQLDLLPHLTNSGSLRPKMKTLKAILAKKLTVRTMSR